MYNIFMKYDKSIEIQYIIKNLEFDIQFDNDFFSNKDKKQIKNTLDMITKTIYIDKSYVESSKNKHNNTFLVENGWELLKQTIIESEFGIKLSKSNQEMLVETISTMAKCYVYSLLINYYEHDYPNINEYIHISPSLTSKFDVIICKDTSNEWKSYKGDWTQWEK